MTKWQEVKLGDVCIKITDGSHWSPKTCEVGFPMASVKDMEEYKINLSSCRKISKEDYQELVKNDCKPLKNDVLIAKDGSYLKQAFEVKTEEDVVILSSIAIIRPNLNLILPTFLKYIFKNQEFIEIVKKNYVSGAVIPRIILKDFKNIPISLPPLEVQKKIAGVLGALDDKIELNNKINNNLEQQAQALFKSWFVDIKETSQNNEKFGYIPQNATVKKVGELPVFITDYVANGSFASLKENVTLYQNKNYAYFIRNTDLKSNSFEVYVDEHSYKFLSKSSLFGNEIIISNVGDVGSVFLCPKLDLPMTLGNNIIMLRAEKDSYLGFYLYIWFKWSYGQELIQGIKGGSAQPKFNKTDFKGLPVILPSQQQLKEFNEAVTPMFNKISQNNTENTRLAAIRDALLPKLMSGEIDVSNVDISALTSTDKLSFTEE